MIKVEIFFVITFDFISIIAEHDRDNVIKEDARMIKKVANVILYLKNDSI